MKKPINVGSLSAVRRLKTALWRLIGLYLSQPEFSWKIEMSDSPLKAPAFAIKPLMPSLDELVAGARSAPELLAQAEVYNPALARRLTGEATLESKTLWGSALAMALSWAASRWGLGWDPTFCATLAGLATLGVHALVHSLTNKPLTTLGAKPPAPSSSLAASK